MMKYLTTLFYIVFVFAIKNVNAAEINTLGILTNNSHRFWNVMGSNSLGACFHVNGDFEEFLYKKRVISCNEEKVCRHFTPSCNVMGILGMEYRVKDCKIVLFYKRNPNTIVKKYDIAELSETIICLVNENDTLVYYLANDQETPITAEPELQGGYEIAKIQDSNVIYSIIDSLQVICRNKRMGSPLSFQVNVMLRIDDNGFICNAKYVMGNIDIFPGKESERYFYSLLLDKIKQIRFVPAKNETNNEKYYCELIMPINYKQRGRFGIRDGL